jgi:CheY-like chemotaxis protein
VVEVGVATLAIEWSLDVEPVSILVASATFLAAEVARKPADALATKLWETVKGALRKILDREPTPTDVSAATIRKAEEEFPAVAGALQAARSSSSGLRRAEHVGHVLRGARVLWVDDHPENNAWERELFRVLGVTVVAVESTRSAVACLGAEPFDVVISDIHRDNESVDGIQGAQQIHDAMPTLPIVFYTGHLTSTRIPEPASGITNEPNELLHLVLDRLERTRV